ncbi:MAG TPA: hypothetical protein VLR90_05905, partial [Blastocatellia bacterium]|nr:hypothetical protein [Blastocatellia bacterium]
MRCVSFLLVCLVVLFIAGSAHAQNQTPTSPAEKSTEQVSPPGVADKEKQEVKTYTLPPEKYEKAIAYSKAGYRLHFIAVAYTLLILLIILKLRI